MPEDTSLSINPFQVGDIVHFRHPTKHKAHGKVVAIACYRATKVGDYTCSRDGCTHPDKEHVWIEWPGKSGFSYHFEELVPSVMEIARKRFKDRIDKEIKATTSLGKAIETSEPSNGENQVNTVAKIVHQGNHIPLYEINWPTISVGPRGIH